MKPRACDIDGCNEGVYYVAELWRRGRDENGHLRSGHFMALCAAHATLLMDKPILKRVDISQLHNDLVYHSTILPGEWLYHASVRNLNAV